ncbi:MAG: DUF4345 domain-containing protein, partial [Pseudomonadota bacterium]
QIALGIFSLIPLYFAILGIATGASYFMPDGGYPAAIDNQFRYLSAIYLLVTMLLWWTIPNVEKQGMVLALVCAAIFIGGLARYFSYSTVGPGSDEQFAGMIIELCVPVFLIWQRLVARKAAAA